MTIDLIIYISHDPSMYTLSMSITLTLSVQIRESEINHNSTLAVARNIPVTTEPCDRSHRPIGCTKNL